LGDRRLYRNSDETFEDYCGDRFGFKLRHPYRLVDAADVVDNLIGTPAYMRTIGTQTDKEKNLTTNGT